MLRPGSLCFFFVFFVKSVADSSKSVADSGEG